VTWTLRLRTDEAKAEMHQKILEAQQSVFELDIKPDAVQNSPRKTGTNARSIDQDTLAVAQGVQSELYTQSGYGGYLELGTRRMKAQPYLYPAFQRGMEKLEEGFTDIA
jgi:HK97 gp10 family phage protein